MLANTYTLIAEAVLRSTLWVPWRNTAVNRQMHPTWKGPPGCSLKPTWVGIPTQPCPNLCNLVGVGWLHPLGSWFHHL